MDEDKNQISRRSKQHFIIIYQTGLWLNPSVRVNMRWYYKAKCIYALASKWHTPTVILVRPFGRNIFRRYSFILRPTFFSNWKEKGQSIWEMDVQSVHVNLKAIWKEKPSIKQTEILRWQIYINRDFQYIVLHDKEKNTLPSIEIRN